MVSERKSSTTFDDTLVSPEQQPAPLQLSKTDQYDEVVKLCNLIKEVTRSLQTLIKKYQTTIDSMNKEIDSPLIPRRLQMIQTKSKKRCLRQPMEITSEMRASVLVLEEFENTFRAEWKSKKKADLKQRQMFIAGKQREVDEQQRKCMDRVGAIANDVRRLEGQSVEIEGSDSSV